MTDILCRELLGTGNRKKRVGRKVLTGPFNRRRNRLMAIMYSQFFPTCEQDTIPLQSSFNPEFEGTEMRRFWQHELDSVLRAWIEDQDVVYFP